MKATNVLSSLAKSIYSALLNDLSEIEYQGYKDFADRKIKKFSTLKRKPQEYDLNVIHFQEMWSSTALGFSGWGGAAMTHAYSTIVICDNEACVYFNGQLAYKCTDDMALREVLNKRQMPSQDKAKKELNLI